MMVTCVVLSYLIRKDSEASKKQTVAVSWLMIGRMGQSGFHLSDSSFDLEKSGGETNCGS